MADGKVPSAAITSCGLNMSATNAVRSMPFFPIVTSVPFTGSSAYSSSEAKGSSSGLHAMPGRFPPFMKKTSRASPGLGRFFDRLQPVQPERARLDSGPSCGKGTIRSGLYDG